MSGIPMNSVPLLQGYIAELNAGALVSLSSGEFKAKIEEFLKLSDYVMEGLPTAQNQRRQMVSFSWGHDHDFGDFNLKGEMGTRHIWLISRLIDAFGALPRNLAGKKVLDVGCWTGGVSLLLAMMGARVVAIDEVKKYTDCVDFLAQSFGLNNLAAHHMSLYDLDKEGFLEEFDHVLCLGVIYHVSDPIVALRYLYNSLKPNGILHLETLGIDSSESICCYEGPTLKRGRSGWNWFVPSPLALGKMLADTGFEIKGLGDGISEYHLTAKDDPLGPSRLLAVASKKKHFEMTRAGLSQPRIR